MVDALRGEDDRGVIGRCLGRQRQGFDGHTAREAAKWVLTRLFAELQQQFNGLPIEERRRAAERILRSVEHLDPATQARIRDELEIDRLGIEALLRTGALATLGGVLSATVALGGFGAYAFLNSAIAAVAGLVGLTLPFGVYVFATSTLAFLSNPLTLAVLTLGGGALLRSRANAAIRDRYLTVLVTLSIIAHANPSDHQHPTDALVSHARRRYSEFIGASPSERRAYQRAFPAFREIPAG